MMTSVIRIVLHIVPEAQHIYDIQCLMFLDFFRELEGTVS